MERIKYYSNNNLSINWQLDRLTELLDSLNSRQEETVIDILELYNVALFLENNLYPSSYSTIQIENKLKSIYTILGRYFGFKKNNDILTDLNYLFSTSQTDGSNKTNYHARIQYREDYLKCFEKYKLHNKFEEKDFEKFIHENNLTVCHLLNTNYFSCVYPNLVKYLFLKEPNNFKLLLNNYTFESSNYFIPKEITSDEMYKLAEKYIQSPYANSKYLTLIEQNIQGLKELTINAKLKLKAQKRKIELDEELFSNRNKRYVQTGTTYSIGIFTNREEYKESTPHLKNLIDIEYLQNNNRPEVLLEYIMYLDGFFNNNWILNLCSFPNLESSPFLSLISDIKTNKHYERSFQFERKNEMILMCFNLFQGILKKELKTRVEDLLTYFFSDYSITNFNINWFTPSFASSLELQNIQTKNLFTVEEQIRKQWKLLVEENEIDPELLKLESTPSITSLTSLLEKKYVYINKNNKYIEKILFLLFSDQSTLGYIDELTREEVFAQLIISHNVNISDFRPDQTSDIYFLKEKKIITIDQAGQIHLTEKQKFRIAVLQELYNYGVINYYHCLDSFETKIYSKEVLKQQQQALNKMIDDNLLCSENTLFSRSEIDYLNYVLNDSSFNNSLGLRNKYLHGSILEDNNEDYLYILIILTVYVIKINEELCLSMP